MIGRSRDTCSHSAGHAGELVPPHSQCSEWPKRLRGLLQAMTRRGSKNSEAVLIRSHQQRQPSRFALGYWHLLPSTTSCTVRRPVLTYSEKCIFYFLVLQRYVKSPVSSVRPEGRGVSERGGSGCSGLHCSAAQRSCSAAVRQKRWWPSPAQPSCSCHLNCYFHLTRKYRTLLTTHSSTQHGLRSPHCAHPFKHRLNFASCTWHFPLA